MKGKEKISQKNHVLEAAQNVIHATDVSNYLLGITMSRHCSQGCNFRAQRDLRNYLVQSPYFMFEDSKAQKLKITWLIPFKIKCIRLFAPLKISIYLYYSMFVEWDLIMRTYYSLDHLFKPSIKSGKMIQYNCF